MAPLWLAACLLAQDGAKAKPQSPAAAEYQKIVGEVDAANASFSKAMKELQASDEYKQAVADKDRAAMTELTKKVTRPDMSVFGKKALEAAEKYAGKDDAVPLLGLALMGPDKETAQKSADILLQSHTKSPKLVEIVENPLHALPNLLGKEKANELLDKVIAENPSSLVQAWTMYWKSQQLSRGRDASSEDKEEAQKLLDKAEQLADGTELADRIRGPRFAKEKLQIGMEAPDISGVDLDGKTFKLSDYRGKVVVLDFWGDW